MYPADQTPRPRGSFVRDEYRPGPGGDDLRMNGWLMWGLILPILLVVAGIITLQRRKGRR